MKVVFCILLAISALATVPGVWSDDDYDTDLVRYLSQEMAMASRASEIAAVEEEDGDTDTDVDMLAKLVAAEYLQGMLKEDDVVSAQQRGRRFRSRLRCQRILTAIMRVFRRQCPRSD